MARCVISKQTARVPVGTLLAEAAAICTSVAAPELDAPVEVLTDCPVEAARILKDVAEAKAVDAATPTTVVDDQLVDTSRHHHHGGLRGLLSAAAQRPALLFLAEVSAELIIHLTAHLIASGFIAGLKCLKKKKQPQEEEEQEQPREE